jgi:hypothetical protein
VLQCYSVLSAARLPCCSNAQSFFFEGEEKPVQSRTYFLDTFNSIFHIIVVSFTVDTTLTSVVD